MGLGERKSAEFLNAATAHSLAVHGDERVHPDCEECLEFIREMLYAYGTTAKELLGRYEKSGLAKDNILETIKVLVREEEEGKDAWNK